MTDGERLIKIETIVAGIDKKVTEICALNGSQNDKIIKNEKDIIKVKASTSVQWILLSTIMLGLLGAAIKIILAG